VGVVFESLIKMGEEENWFSELTDTVQHRMVTCHNLDEYSQKVEAFGADYGEYVDEVKCSKDENIPPPTMDEIRLKMSKHQEKIEKEKEHK